MKLWIVLALIGMASAAPAPGRVGHSITVQEYDPIAGCWVVRDVITDKNKMREMVAKNGDKMNHVELDGNAPCQQVGDVVYGPVVPCDVPELAGPSVKLPCAEVDAPTQTKVTRKPVFRGYDPVIVNVDGQKWKCTNVGRSKSSPCLPGGRVINRACEKTIAPAPEIIVIDEDEVIVPCEEPVVVVEPCATPTIVVDPCVSTSVSASASASASSSSKFDLPCLSSVGSLQKNINDLATGTKATASASSSFSSSASASASACASSSSSFSLTV